MSEKIISYWRETKEIYRDKENSQDNGLIFIIGQYDHKNRGKPSKALGIHWRNFPISRGVLAPCVVPEKTRAIILAGLLHQAMSEKNTGQIEEIMRAIDYFSKD
ncbi:MAG: hypothetical protein Q4A84_03065 [Neisseria sp.]|uniref:hypothetical protein n=1 Tax=Neisseria sp. TaxID=192066 RepID=UPI0026DAEA2D|nr:hypothetical protein [Neisseria sp.]MDO4640670.1 hypothetical protein [Neisseria sp.]